MQQLFGQLMTPFTVFNLTWNILFVYPFCDNSLKRPDSVLGDERVCGFSKDISLPDLKKACRYYKCTVNDACRSIMGQAIKAYANSHDDPNLNKILLSSTFSLNPFAKNESEVKCANFWVPKAYHIPVDLDLK